MQDLNDGLSICLHGIGDDRVVRVSVTVAIVAVQRSGDNAAIGHRHANGFSNKGFDFVIGHESGSLDVGV